MVRSHAPVQQDEIGTLARGAAVAVAGRVGGRGLQFIVQAVLARTLGPQLFGLYALGWAVLRVATLVTPLGLENAAVRFGASAQSSGLGAFWAVIKRSLQLAVLSGIGVSLLMGFGAPLIAKVLFQKPELAPVLIVLAPAFAAAAVLRVGAYASRVSERMGFGALSEDIGQPTIQLLAVVASTLFGWGVYGAAGAASVSFVGAAVAAVAILPRIYSAAARAPREPGPPIGQLLRYSLPTALSSFFGMLVIWLDRLFVGHYLPLKEIGIYQVASQMAIVFAIMLAGFNQIFAPMVARWYHRGDMVAAHAMYRVSTKWALYLSLPLFVIVLLGPGSLLALAFGEQYRSGATVLLLLAIGQMLNVATGSVGKILIMTGLERDALRLSILAFAVNVVGCVLLIPRYGLNGAAISTSLSIATLFGGGLLRVWRAHGLWPYDRRYAKGLTAALVALLSGALVGIAPVSELAAFALRIAVVSVVFVSSLSALGFDPEDHQVMVALWHRMKIAWGRRRS